MDSELIHLSVPKEMFSWLKQEKTRRQISMQVLVRLALEEYRNNQTLKTDVLDGDHFRWLAAHARRDGISIKMLLSRILQQHILGEANSYAALFAKETSE